MKIDKFKLNEYLCFLFNRANESSFLSKGQVLATLIYNFKYFVHSEFHSAAISWSCGDWLDSREIWLALIGVSAWIGVPSVLLPVSCRDIVLDVDPWSPIRPSSAFVLEDEDGVLEIVSIDIPGPSGGINPTRFGLPSLKKYSFINYTKHLQSY